MPSVIKYQIFLMERHVSLPRVDLIIAKVEGEAIVLYRKPLTTQVDDPVSAGRYGILDFCNVRVEISLHCCGND